MPSNPGEVVLAFWQLLHHVGDVARQIVSRGALPEGLAGVLDRDQRRRDGEDVLGTPAVVARVAADEVQRVVADGARDISEVEVPHLVAIGRQLGADLLVEAALGVHDQHGAGHLQDVGFEDVAGLTGARGADDQHVVVEPRAPGVAGELVAVGEDGRSLECLSAVLCIVGEVFSHVGCLSLIGGLI